MPGPFDSYKVGEIDRYGEKISFIVNRSTEVIVYTIADGDLMIDTVSETPTARALEILQTYDRLHSCVLVGARKSQSLPLKKDLGAALFRAISDKNGTGSTTAYFDDVSEHINNLALNTTRFVYLTAGLSFAIAASLALYLGYLSQLPDLAQAPSTVIGAIGGMIGSALSIFRRSNTLEVSPYQERAFLLSRASRGLLWGRCLGSYLFAALRGTSY
jgi:hypothetical protein